MKDFYRTGQIVQHTAISSGAFAADEVQTNTMTMWELFLQSVCPSDA